MANPFAGMIISTRETKECRTRLLDLGISQISGGSKTSVGGYAEKEKEDSSQFDISDTRSLDEIVGWLIENGHIPSFCTSCYRSGRVGADFMKYTKAEQIHNFCTPNALMTLDEYLEDYASQRTKLLGQKLIKREVAKMQPSAIKDALAKNLELITSGSRDLRF